MFLIMCDRFILFLSAQPWKDANKLNASKIISMQIQKYGPFPNQIFFILTQSAYLVGNLHLFLECTTQKRITYIELPFMLARLSFSFMFYTKILLTCIV